MEKLKQPTTILALAAIGYGLYGVGKAIWYKKTDQGCNKCEFTSALLGGTLAGVASWVLAKENGVI